MVRWAGGVLCGAAGVAPSGRVGGLAEAASGLGHELRSDGVDVEVVIPDYFDTPLADETLILPFFSLTTSPSAIVPSWQLRHNLEVPVGWPGRDFNVGLS